MWSDKGHTEVTKVEVGHEGFYATLAHSSRLVDQFGRPPASRPVFESLEHQRDARVTFIF